MIKTLDMIDWEALRAPFNPDDVDFRLQSSFMKDNKLTGIAIAYMDARLVQDRLDEVVGPENWSFDWQPMATKDNAVIAAKGILTIAGVSKSDIGDCDVTEKNKASVSDAFKRAAVMWGIGRYLYGLGTFYCDVEVRGEKKILPDKDLPKLRAKLPRPGVPSSPTPIRQERGNVQTTDTSPATDRQVESIRKLCAALNRAEPDAATMSFATARDMLTDLNNAYSEARQAAPTQPVTSPTTKPRIFTPAARGSAATQNQMDGIRKLSIALKRDVPENLGSMSFDDARVLMGELSATMDAKRNGTAPPEAAVAPLNNAQILNKFMTDNKVSELGIHLYCTRHQIKRLTMEGEVQLTAAIQSPEGRAEILLIHWTHQKPFKIEQIDTYMKQERIASYGEFSEIFRAASSDDKALIVESLAILAKP